MTNHTKGYWRVSGQAGYAGFKVIDGAGKSIAAFPSTSTRPEHERTANAHLIAAAPELLAALQKAVWFLNNNGGDEITWLPELKAAIARATNEGGTL